MATKNVEPLVKAGASASANSSIPKTTYPNVKLVGHQEAGRLCLMSKGFIYYPSSKVHSKVKLPWSSVVSGASSSSILTVTCKNSQTLKFQAPDNWTLIQVMCDMMDRIRRDTMANHQETLSAAAVDDEVDPSWLSTTTRAKTPKPKILSSRRIRMDPPGEVMCSRIASSSKQLMPDPTGTSSSSKRDTTCSTRLLSSRSEHRRHTRPQQLRRAIAPDLCCSETSPAPRVFEEDDDHDEPRMLDDSMASLDGPSMHLEDYHYKDVLDASISETSRTDEFSSSLHSLSSHQSGSSETPPLLLKLIEAQLSQEEHDNSSRKDPIDPFRRCLWWILTVGTILLGGLVVVIIIRLVSASSTAPTTTTPTTVEPTSGRAFIGRVNRRPSASAVGRVTRRPTRAPAPANNVWRVTRRPTTDPPTPIPTTRPPTPLPTPSPTLRPTTMEPTPPPRKPKNRVEYGTVSHVGERNLAECPISTMAKTLALSSAFNFTFASTYSSLSPTTFAQEHEANFAVASFHFLAQELHRIYPDSFQSLTGEEASSQMIETFCDSCQKQEMVYQLSFRVILTFSDCMHPTEMLHSVPPTLKYKKHLGVVNRLVGSRTPHDPFVEVRAMQGHEACSTSCGRTKPKKKH